MPTLLGNNDEAGAVSSCICLNAAAHTCPCLLQELSRRFTAIRKTKGDGNCFYRALGYSYLESLLGKGREILK